jgi:broad specificity phosphatase PhoE
MSHVSRRARRLVAGLTTSTMLGAVALTIGVALPGRLAAQEHQHGAAATAAPVTTVILVRHAERATEPANDPVITAEGQDRARRLLQVVKDAGVNAILTTQFQRTKLTAQPVAEALGLTPEVVAASGQSHPAEVAKHIREKLSGKTVLVVGHSNTINAIAAALGAAHPGVIEDSVYDNLYVVTLGADGKGRIIKAKF